MEPPAPIGSQSAPPSPSFCLPSGGRAGPCRRRRIFFSCLLDEAEPASSATPYKEIWERDYPDWALGSCIYTQTWCTTDYMLISTDHAVIHGIHTLALQAKLQQPYPVISTEDILSSNTLPQSQPLTRLRLNLNSFNFDAVIGFVNPSAN